jgi:integrase/recombinase XerD
MSQEPLLLSQAIRYYLFSCEAKNLSPETLDWYQEKFRHLIRYLGDRSIDEITPDLLRQMVLYFAQDHPRFPNLPPKQRGTGLAPNTINGYIRALKSLCSYLVEEGLLEKNPVMKIRQLKVAKDAGTTLTQQELQALLGTSTGPTFTERRNRAFLLLLADTGIRISEVLRLTLRDIEWGQRTITVMGKGAKVRTVPFGKNTTRALNSYLALRRGTVQSENLLFVTIQGEGLPVRRAQRIIDTLTRQAGIKGKRVTPHTFRRTFATLWISNGGDPFSLQRMLGHTTMEMVNRYVRLSTVDLQRRHSLIGPVDQIKKKWR